MTDETKSRSWVLPTVEVVVSLATSALFPLLCLNIKVDPLQRIGQVSGLSSMGLRYTLMALPLIGILVLAARLRSGAWFGPTTRLACAAVAGMATGMIAGGVIVALRGTPWGLNGRNGDAGVMIDMTDAARRGDDLPVAYPPLPMYLLAWYADAFDIASGHAIKHMQIAGTAILGPATYLSWRLVLRPCWALGVGLVAALPLIDAAPYKPYGNMVLMMFIPIMIAFMRVLRRSGDYTLQRNAQLGALFGGGIGLLCLTYSGWFQWSAPGVLVALLVLFPWRGDRKKALVFCGMAALLFALVAGRYMYGVLTDPTGIKDNYIYFDVNAEPWYIAMWRGDLPGPVGMWPPLGEMGGVGLFTLILCVGLGLSVALGRSRTPVITVGWIMAGCWLWRFWYAHFLWKTKLVQLYPRTTLEIQYCLLVLCGYAVYLLVDRFKQDAPADSPLRTPSAAIGAICAFLLLFGSVGSAISDHYMPNNGQPISPGWLAWTSHQTE